MYNLIHIYTQFSHKTLKRKTYEPFTLKHVTQKRRTYEPLTLKHVTLNGV